MTIEKIEVLSGVREYCEEMAVELWRLENGRLVVRAYNEAGHSGTEVDLLDLIEWLSRRGLEFGLGAKEL